MDAEPCATETCHTLGAHKQPILDLRSGPAAIPFQRSIMRFSDGESDSGTDPAISTIHHTLRAPRRRLVVEIIGRRTFLDSQTCPNCSESRWSEISEGDVISARQLARSIVAIEDEIPQDNASGKEYHTTYTSLVQTHLPQLNDAGVVKFDAERKTIQPGTNLLLAFILTSITVPLVHRFFLQEDKCSYDRTNGPEPSMTDY